MGCPAGGKRLLPPVHILQHIEREGGKRLRKRRPTPRFRRKECPKEIAAPDRTALHSTGAVRFPVFAGYPSGNPHTPPYDGGCTPPHTKPLFRTTPGEATCCPPSAHDRALFRAAPGDGRQNRNACATQRSPEAIATAFGGGGVDASHDSKLGRGNVPKKGPPPQIQPVYSSPAFSKASRASAKRPCTSRARESTSQPFRYSGRRATLWRASDSASSGSSPPSR